jgi:hypothetical protein
VRREVLTYVYDVRDRVSSQETADSDECKKWYKTSANLLASSKRDKVTIVLVPTGNQNHYSLTFILCCLDPNVTDSCDADDDTDDTSAICMLHTVQYSHCIHAHPTTNQQESKQRFAPLHHSLCLSVDR